MKDEVTGWVCLGRRQPRCPQVMCILDQPTRSAQLYLIENLTLYLIVHPWSTYRSNTLYLIEKLTYTTWSSGEVE